MLNINTLSPEERSKLFYVSLITVISLCGLYLRLKGLGKFPFSIDEYYFYSAVKLTLENGLPNFACGGFYSRGILLQYFTAPFVYIFENQELAARIPSVIFSALSFPAVYLIGKDSHSRLAGVLALFLFAFSIWQIEFARFARMYAPFQMIFLWQVWLFLRPNLPNRSANIAINGVLACIASLFYAGGIFCVALAFFNVLLNQKSFKFTNYLPASIAAGIAITLTVIPFRFMGAIYPYPTDYLKNIPIIQDPSASATNTLPIDLPTFLSFSNHSFLMLGLLFLYAVVVVFFLYKTFINKKLSALTKMLILAALLALLLNQLLLSICLAAVCLLTSDKWHDLLQLFLNKAGAILLICSSVWIISCTAYFLASHDAQGLTNIAKGIFNNFFSYPDIFYDVFRQWQKPMLAHSLITIISLVFITAICTLNHFHSITKTRHLLSIVIVMLLLVATINTPYNTSRYSFFLSPLISIVIAICIAWSASKLSNKLASISIILVSTLILCITSEDYRLNHILNIDSYASNHRQPYEKEFTEHLYPRYDYISVADYINNHAKTNELVIVTTPVIEHYLSPEQQAAYFITPENPEFVNHSACQGKVESWSNLPLIHNYQDLNIKLADKNTNKWIILHGVRGNPFSTQQLESLKSRLSPYLAYESPDNSLKVYKVGSNNY